MSEKDLQQEMRDEIATIKEFLKDSNRLKKRIKSTLNDVEKIRAELNNFLSNLNDLQVRGLDEFLDGDSGVSDTTSQSDLSRTDSSDSLQETSRTSSEDSDYTDSPEFSGEQDPESNGPDPTDRPVRAGDFTSGDDYSWNDTESGETDPISTTKQETQKGDTPSYQRRMVRKDPRLADLPEDVLDTIADVEELIQEAERGIQFLDSLSVKSRSAQIAIWAGRARKIQDDLEDWKEVLPSELFQKIHVFFGKLTTVTRDTECEWIDALKRSYETDWARYLEEQKRKLKMNLQREERAREFLKEPPKERKKDRKICRRRLRELANKKDPDPEEVKSALTEGMDLLAFDDPAVTEVAARFSDLLEEEEQFEPLREVIKDKAGQRTRKEDQVDQPEVHPRPTFGPNVGDDVLNLTKNKRAIAVGDAVTRDWKRRIENAFQFETFRWVEVEDENGDELKDLKGDENVDRFDYIFLMKSRLNNNYSRAAEICDSLSPQTLVVEEGVGIAPIRDSLKNAMLSTNK